MKRRSRGQQKHARNAAIQTKAAQEFQRQQKEFYEKLDDIKDGHDGSKRK